MNKKRKLFVIITIIFVMVATTLTGCNAKKEEKPKEVSKEASATKTVIEEEKHGNPKELIWEIKKDKATVYLFGSIPTDKKDLYPFDKTIEDAFNNSDNLVVETIWSANKGTNNDESKVMYPENDDIYNHISKEEKEKLDACAKEVGMDMETLKKMKPNMVVSTIVIAQLQKLGCCMDYNVDMYFQNKAKGNKKTLEQEGSEFLGKLLDSISEKELNNVLLDNIKDLKQLGNEFNKSYEAYKVGDEKELVKLNLDPSRKYTSYYKKMITDRYIGMAEKIDGYLKTNESYFVVAGIDNFIGDDSVIKLLEKKGYTVKRLE